MKEDSKLYVYLAESGKKPYTVYDDRFIMSQVLPGYEENQDSLAGPQFAEGEYTVEFSDEVWKSCCFQER